MSPLTLPKLLRQIDEDSVHDPAQCIDLLQITLYADRLHTNFDGLKGLALGEGRLILTPCLPVCVGFSVQAVPGSKFSWAIAIRRA